MYLLVSGDRPQSSRLAPNLRAFLTGGPEPKQSYAELARSKSLSCEYNYLHRIGFYYEGIPPMLSIYEVC